MSPWCHSVVSAPLHVCVCRLGLDDAQLEQLEEQLEHKLAKHEIAAFAKEASESIDTYKKRCCSGP